MADSPCGCLGAADNCTSAVLRSTGPLHTPDICLGTDHLRFIICSFCPVASNFDMCNFFYWLISAREHLYDTTLAFVVICCTLNAKKHVLHGSFKLRSFGFSYLANANGSPMFTEFHFKFWPYLRWGAYPVYTSIQYLNR